MAAACALALFCGKIFLYFVAQKRLRAFLSHFFTVGVVKKNGIYKEPSQSSLRDASSPEGGA